MAESKGLIKKYEEASQWILKIAPRFSLQRIRNCEGKTTAVGFDWLLSQNEGVYVVRLWGSPSDHCIVINADDSLIFDSCERQPLTLCLKALEACCGDNTIIIKIPEVRILVKSEPGSIFLKKRAKRARRE